MKKEVKIEDFINLRQGNMSVGDYSLNFTLLSKYAPYLLSNPRDKMSRLLKSISDLVNEECRTTILHDNRTLSRFITYS